MPLTPDDLVLLASAFDEIVVSVDGGKEEHDLRRGKGSYDKTVRNLESYMDLLGQGFRAIREGCVRHGFPSRRR
jgi:MoaA/NifB/PqqE/SkfB family radical SAM enzyme